LCILLLAANAHAAPRAHSPHRAHSRHTAISLKHVEPAISQRHRTVEGDDPADDAGEELGSVVQRPDSTDSYHSVAATAPTRKIIPAPHPDTALCAALPRSLSTPRAPPA
jgi:hypothetical protein